MERPFVRRYRVPAGPRPGSAENREDRLNPDPALGYHVGAALAGTILVLPYAGRALLALLWPGGLVPDAPFFLLPIAFGAWNVVWVRRCAPLGAVAWGALLGVVVAVGGNVLMALRGMWAPSLLLLFGWIPTVYAIARTFLVAPLNEALDVDG